MLSPQNYERTRTTGAFALVGLGQDRTLGGKTKKRRRIIECEIDCPLSYHQVYMRGEISVHMSMKVTVRRDELLRGF